MSDKEHIPDKAELAGKAMSEAFKQSPIGCGCGLLLFVFLSWSFTELLIDTFKYFIRK
jgi:hypothetical protein